MITGDFKKWLSVGTGIGVEIRDHDLFVSIVRVRPKEVRVLAAATIRNYTERPANEWGAEYNKFLAESGFAHLTATVLLPRNEVIVRQLSLPGVGGKDLRAAINYQADGLHPYPDDEASFGWARIPGSPVVLIGIVRTAIIEHYSALFAEAGVRTAALSFSAALVYSAARIGNTPPSEGFLVLEQAGEETEAYGESPARPVFSATFDLPAERIVPLVSAELRLDPDHEPIRLLDILPAPSSTPEEWNLNHYLPSYAAALAGACPWLALPANLLPEEQRSRSSRTVYAPTVALAALLLVVLGVLWAYSGMKERDYVAAIEQEISRYSGEAGRVGDIEAATAQLHARREVIREFRTRTHADLGALRDLTIILPPPVWLRGLLLTRAEVTINGEAPEAGQLLETLDSSIYFRNSEYTSPISDAGALQSFAIRLMRESPGDGEQQ